MTDQVRSRTGARPTVYVDATGVGQPVVDHLRERVLSGEVVAIWFTYGDQRTKSWEGDHLRVTLGKGYMVSRLQVLLGTGRLHLPRTEEYVTAFGVVLHSAGPWWTSTLASARIQHQKAPETGPPAVKVEEVRMEVVDPAGVLA